MVAKFYIYLSSAKNNNMACLDGTGPNGVSECSKFLERCTDPLWSDVMRKTCPRSCGFCSTESSSDSLGSSDQDFYSQEEKKGNQLNLSASPFISIDEVPFINGWTVKRLRDYNASTGSFPPVEEYLPADYIENLLDLFRDGVSFLMTENSLDQFGREMLGKPDNNRFVIPRAYMDLVLLTANGNISVIESELGIPAGHWRGHQMVRIDVPEPQKLNLRMATGNENGANQLWIPGGLLPNGIPEAIIDNVPEGMYTETRLQFPSVFGTQYEYGYSKECRLPQHIGRFQTQQLAEQKKLYVVSWTVVVTLP
uniref:ShKT domain-containing protein n=1 Tax=Ditylenchus dipsaci TaxID=166011 RepID=A0A915DSY3_9BILA